VNKPKPPWEDEDEDEGQQSLFFAGDPSACLHQKTVLLRLNCGAGGVQYREYCLTCWCDLRGAIRHADALAKLRGKDAPWGNLEVLHGARDAWLRRKGVM
jgi:hypothetical protein